MHGGVLHLAFSTKPPGKPELHVIVAGDSPSVKCCWGHCMQVTTHQGWGVDCKIRCGPPGSWSPGLEGALLGGSETPQSSPMMNSP